MTYHEDAVKVYENMVRERHRIWKRRQDNEPGPWTKHPILANKKFTNMFRVLDPGSQFVFDLDDDNPVDVIARLVLYRITNRPKTWYFMRNVLSGRYPTAEDLVDATTSAALEDSLKAYRDAGNQVFSGAYIILPEPGTRNDKIEGVLRVTRRFILDHMEEFLLAETQEDRYAALRRTPGLGPFLAMQVLADWSYLLPEQPDLSFVVAGPGARKGAAILNPDLPAERVILDMAFDWQMDKTVRLGGRALTPMDVQNSLCEFSKFYRELVEPRKKTPYKPAHPGPQPKPRVPAWW